MLTSGPRSMPISDRDVLRFRTPLTTHQRPHEWTKPPRRIELIECIGCDSCMRACPPQFNAVYNYGLDVVIVPEMCNGCGKCVQACPVDCIYLDPDWAVTSPSLWRYVETQEIARVRA